MADLRVVAALTAGVPLLLGVIAYLSRRPGAEARRRRELWGWRPPMDENGHPLGDDDDGL